MGKKFEWQLTGEAVEGCTSPPVCPAYWSSPLPKELHDGKSQCESAFTFSIKQGHYENIELNGLKVVLAFNIVPGFPEVIGNWPGIIFIDDKADEKQANALEMIYKKCWERAHKVMKVKRSEIKFTKELIEGGPAARFEIEMPGVYLLKTMPFLTDDNKPRYITTRSGGIINVGKSEVNEFKDTDLPHIWNRPGMTNTYFDFSVNPQKLSWLP
jgi:hypothetical protein